MSSSSSNPSHGPPPSNPILTAYESFLHTTPLVTRYVLTTLSTSYLISWFVDPTMALSNIALFTVYKLELYRILTSPLVCTNALTLVFAFLSFNDHGRRLEYGLGSAGFAALLLTIAGLTNVAFVVLCLIHHLLTGSQMALLLPSTGIWPVLLGTIAVECSSAPLDQQRRLFNLEIKTRYYPLVLLGLFTLLGGFHPVYFLGVGVGYAYGMGKLDQLKVTQSRLTRWEDGCLANFTRRRGWVAGHAASGSGSSQLPTSSSSTGGGWNPASFFSGDQDGGGGGGSAGGGGGFPSGGGRSLGGGGGGGMPGSVAAPTSPVEPTATGFPSSGGRSLSPRRVAPRTEEAKHAAMVAAAERRAAEAAKLSKEMEAAEAAAEGGEGGGSSRED